MCDFFVTMCYFCFGAVLIFIFSVLMSVSICLNIAVNFGFDTCIRWLLLSAISRASFMVSISVCDSVIVCMFCFPCFCALLHYLCVAGFYLFVNYRVQFLFVYFVLSCVRSTLTGGRQAPSLVSPFGLAI